MAKIIILEGEDTKAQLRLQPGKTVLGRNVKDLHCTDKKVSREHALIEVHPDGKVELTATHINPCFIQTEDSGSKSSLKKSDKIVLKEGDKFSLLPTQFIYKLVIEEKDSDNSTDKIEQEEEDESEEESSEERGRPVRKAVKPAPKVEFINDDEDDDDYSEDESDDDDDFSPESSGSDWEDHARGKKKKKRQPTSDEEDSDVDYGKSKKVKRSSRAVSKKGRTSSGRQQPSRSSRPVSKLSTYIIWKCLEQYFFLAVKNGQIKRQNEVIGLVYAISVNVLLYIFALEPRFIRPSYMKFIDKISDHRLHQVNRMVLDVFGTGASDGYEDWFPNLDPKYMSREFHELIFNWLIQPYD